MKNFRVGEYPERLEWDRLAREIEYLEKTFKAESVIQLFDELFIVKPRLAIFRVFS